MADTTTPLFGLTLPGNLDPAGSGLWGPKVNSDFSSIDGFMGRPQIQFQSPTVGATTTLDLAQGRAFVFTVSQATTIAFTNVPSSSFYVRIRLLITNGSAFVVTWPASVSWLSGVVPTLKVSGVDEIEMATKDGGTTWFATIRDLKPGNLYQNVSLSTTSGSEVSLATFALPAGLLAVNGQGIRITASGQAPAGGGHYTLKFGAAGIDGETITGNAVYVVRIDIVRTGAATQAAYVSLSVSAGANSPANSAFPTETLSGAITIDFRANATTGGQTMKMDIVRVEFLST
jgi:hypothetical protein